jgi:hypothetical protein
MVGEGGAQQAAQSPESRLALRGAQAAQHFAINGVQ